MSEDEIKPCPFCGVVPEQYRDRQFEDWVIYCGNDDCPIEVDVRDSEPAQAITAWNTRAGEQAAYERGEAEERGRVAEALTGWMNASKAAADQWMNVNRTQFDLCYQTYDTLRQVIEIVNQIKE